MAAASAAASSSILEAYKGRKPKAPLPPIILSNVPGTWAYDTMSRRIRDDILARIYAGADCVQAYHRTVTFAMSDNSNQS